MTGTCCCVLRPFCHPVEVCGGSKTLMLQILQPQGHGVRVCPWAICRLGGLQHMLCMLVHDPLCQSAEYAVGECTCSPTTAYAVQYIYNMFMTLSITCWYTSIVCRALKIQYN